MWIKLNASECVCVCKTTHLVTGDGSTGLCVAFRLTPVTDTCGTGILLPLLTMLQRHTQTHTLTPSPSYTHLKTDLHPMSVFFSVWGYRLRAAWVAYKHINGHTHTHNLPYGANTGNKMFKTSLEVNRSSTEHTTCMHIIRYSHWAPPALKKSMDY